MVVGEWIRQQMGSDKAEKFKHVNDRKLRTNTWRCDSAKQIIQNASGVV